MARRTMRRVSGLASTINYDRNDGRPGVVYVLANAAFRDDWFKIGQSTRSGARRASELNFEASTGTPKHFHCVCEVATKDCGRAEKAVHAELAQYRMGATGQEYFCVPLDTAKAVIIEVCGRIDAEPVIDAALPFASHDVPAQVARAKRSSFDAGSVAAQLSLQPDSGKALLRGLNLKQLNAVRRAQAKQLSSAIEQRPSRPPSFADAIVDEAGRLVPSLLCGLSAGLLIGTALMVIVHVANWLNGSVLSTREGGRLATWIFGATSIVATAVLRSKVFQRGR